MTTPTPGWIAPPKQPDWLGSFGISEGASGGEARREEEVGNGQKDIDRARDDRVGHAAEVARQKTRDDPREGRDERRREGDDQRDARSVHGAAEDVAADLIDAEPVLARGAGRGGEEGVERAGVARVGIRSTEDVDDDGRENRREAQERDEDQRRERELVFS